MWVGVHFDSVVPCMMERHMMSSYVEWGVLVARGYEILSVMGGDRRRRRRRRRQMLLKNYLIQSMTVLTAYLSFGSKEQIERAKFMCTAMPAF